MPYSNKTVMLKQILSKCLVSPTVEGVSVSAHLRGTARDALPAPEMHSGRKYTALDAEEGFMYKREKLSDAIVRETRGGLSKKSSCVYKCFQRRPGSLLNRRG